MSVLKFIIRVPETERWDSIEFYDRLVIVEGIMENVPWRIVDGINVFLQSVSLLFAQQSRMLVPSAKIQHSHSGFSVHIRSTITPDVKFSLSMLLTNTIGEMWRKFIMEAFSQEDSRETNWSSVDNSIPDEKNLLERLFLASDVEDWQFVLEKGKSYDAFRAFHKLGKRQVCK